MKSKFYFTYTGAKVYPDDINSLEISLEDIAHHLTKIQRFGGSLDLDINYSVAQHSFLMAEYALEKFDKKVARMCLLHDASEAYIGDIVSPLKAVLKEYKKLENKTTELIFDKYKIEDDENSTKITKMLDTSILLDEVRDLIPNRYEQFLNIYLSIHPLGIKIIPNISPYVVESNFLDMASYLEICDHGEYYEK